MRTRTCEEWLIRSNTMWNCPFLHMTLSTVSNLLKTRLVSKNNKTILIAKRLGKWLIAEMLFVIIISQRQANNRHLREIMMDKLVSKSSASVIVRDGKRRSLITRRFLLFQRGCNQHSSLIQRNVHSDEEDDLASMERRASLFPISE